MLEANEMPHAETPNDRYRPHSRKITKKRPGYFRKFQNIIRITHKHVKAEKEYNVIKLPSKTDEDFKVFLRIRERFIDNIKRLLAFSFSFSFAYAASSFVFIAIAALIKNERSFVYFSDFRISNYLIMFIIFSSTFSVFYVHSMRVLDFRYASVASMHLTVLQNPIRFYFDIFSIFLVILPILFMAASLHSSISGFDYTCTPDNTILNDSLQRACSDAAAPGESNAGLSGIFNLSSTERAELFTKSYYFILFSFTIIQMIADICRIKPINSAGMYMKKKFEWVWDEIGGTRSINSRIEPLAVVNAKDLADMINIYKYRNSILGIQWVIINSIAMILLVMSMYISQSAEWYGKTMASISFLVIAILRNFFDAAISWKSIVPINYYFIYPIKSWALTGFISSDDVIRSAQKKSTTNSSSEVSSIDINESNINNITEKEEIELLKLVNRREMSMKIKYTFKAKIWLTIMYFLTIFSYFFVKFVVDGDEFYRKIAW